VHIIAVYKKGCSGDPNNYRPISLTTNCCKVMERIINSEMLNFLVLSENLITKQQHGFIQKRTTCTNLLENIHDWILNLQARRNTDVIHFDFKKALTLSLTVRFSSSSQLMVCLVTFWHG